MKLEIVRNRPFFGIVYNFKDYQITALFLISIRRGILSLALRSGQIHIYR